MKRLLVSVVLVSGLVLTAKAQAGPDVQKIIGGQDCLSCHSVDQKMVGPSFKQIAARYAGQAGAVKTLARKVINGGGGNWSDVTGGLAMTPHPNLSTPDAEAVVKWILSQK